MPSVFWLVFPFPVLGIFNSMDDDAEEAEDKITGDLIDGVYIWDRQCL